MGGSQCRMSIFRYDHVPCHYIFKCHVDFDIILCRMWILRNDSCRDFLDFNSNVTGLHVAC